MPLVLPPGERLEPAAGELRERARKIRPELTRGPLVRVATARHQAEAELIQGLLLEEGVPSLVKRSAGFDVPDFLAAGTRDVLVAESGVEHARFALAQAEIEPAQASPLPGAKVLRIALVAVAAAAVIAVIAWAIVAVVG